VVPSGISAVLGIQILLLVTTAQVLAVSKGLAVCHHRHADIDVADHLGHGEAVAIGGLGVEGYLAAQQPRQPPRGNR
jgi:hypothetical protein